jgi:hypothetical protein
MSGRTWQFITFAVSLGCWSLAANALLGSHVNPIVVFLLWALGAVAIPYGIIQGSTKGLGYFLAVWLVPLAIAGAFAALIALDHMTY